MRIATTVAHLLVLMLLLCPNWAPAQDLSFYESAEKVRQDRLEKLLALPGVYGVGLTLSQGQAAIVLLVGPTIRQTKLPEKIDGVPIVIDRTPPPILYDGGIGCWGGPYNTNTPASVGCHTETLDRPVPMGVITENQNGTGTGTLGVKVCHEATGHIGYMTCYHVATESGDTNWNGSCAHDLYQFHPWENAVGRIVLGQTQEWVDLTPADEIPHVFNEVDAAFVHSYDLVVSSDLHHMDPPNLSIVREPVFGLCVRKSGRSTGETFGRIVQFNITLRGTNSVGGTTSVSYGCGLGSVDFKNVFKVEVPDDPDQCGRCEGGQPCGIFAYLGDSGAAIVADDGYVGYVFSGHNSNFPDYAYGLPMQPALDGLGVTLNLGACPSVAAIQVTCGGDPMAINDSLEFEPTSLANLPIDRQCSVCNYGSETLVLDNPNGLVSGEGFSQNPFPGQLTPGACDPLGIQFDVDTDGDYSGSVVIQSNNQDGTFAFNLVATVLPDPYIEVQTPVGDSLYGLGDQISILWHYFEAGPFGIELSYDGGNTFPKPIEHLNPHMQMEDWLVSGVPSTDQAVIRVYDLDDGSIFDDSEEFVIDVDPPTGSFNWGQPAVQYPITGRTPTIELRVEDGLSGPNQSTSTGVKFYLDDELVTPIALNWGYFQIDYGQLYPPGPWVQGFTATFDFNSGLFPYSTYTLKAVFKDMAGNEGEEPALTNFPLDS